MTDFLDQFRRKLERRRRLSLAKAIESSKGIALIAEVKKKSPSHGDIRGLDPYETARIMESSGADAISVLTEEKHFGGSLEDLRRVSDAVKIPVMRKDFITDVQGLCEAVAYGADAVLLIAGLLESNTRDFVEEAHRIGLECLVEVHDSKELDYALDSTARMIGVNNRDLKTLRTDLRNCERIIPLIPEGRLVVAESGIHTIEDVERMAKAGADAILVGTSIMKSKDIAAKVSELKNAG
ncbi:MAG: indole-3-glycerol phosphate synthase TrpC [Candidatus Altiarchaeota archaeon]